MATKVNESITSDNLCGGDTDWSYHGRYIYIYIYMIRVTGFVHGTRVKHSYDFIYQF